MTRTACRIDRHRQVSFVSILWREPGFEALMKAIQSAEHRLGARLLFKGQDFARTDLAAAA